MKRVAFAVAGLALVVGVILLRDTDGGNSTLPTAPPPPTKLKPYEAEQVLVPAPQGRPGTPTNVVARGGHHKIQLTWSGDAPGYEVRWGDRTKLVTRPGTQLDGLENEREQQIEIRAVDSFGQRSQPATTKATPRADNAPYTFVDRFDQADEPDLQRWRLTKRTDCARATSGDGEDHDRLIISSSCGTRAVTLRSRTPFVRTDDDSRLVVETDAPGTGGKLLLDLVPGPVSVQGDPVLPNAIRATVSTDVSGNSVVELVPNGTTAKAIPPALPGVTVRWEIVLTRNGTHVTRDGEVVATSPFVPEWREATALVGVAALAGDRIRAGVDLIGYRTAKADAPPAVPTPQVRVDGPASSALPIPDVTSGQLRIALIPSRESEPVTAVKINGVEVPLRPAIPGTPWKPGAEYPAVADLPKEAFTDNLNVALVTQERVQVTHTDVELTGPRSAPQRQPGTPLVDAKPVLADPVPEVLDASGQPIENGAAFTRGRVVIEVRINALDTAVAGLAGFEVRLDGNHVATVPTTTDGPGAAGRWRISLNTASLAEGPHAIEVKAFSTDPEVHPETGYVPFLLKP
ncbi:hypothetical protein [Lentzea flava]|uniref:Fibronectin type-III domain-containing protein n=1 Tax=Lentzea flava TaxID=103732 RepID=A0ABQ2UD05_9PSEU|nr:hypothetical protein [Lentzea flava]MCP2197811.1 hypothetical protein [Lentzea flava]GGU22367.1 hypothetical protein GCM10010178_13390 [Lentzea flava]